jgi:hypothetical protein
MMACRLLGPREDGVRHDGFCVIDVVEHRWSMVVCLAGGVEIGHPAFAYRRAYVTLSAPRFETTLSRAAALSVVGGNDGAKDGPSENMSRLRDTLAPTLYESLLLQDSLQPTTRVFSPVYCL